ncbi:MAG: hypothetical protein OXI79_01255 [Gammaproteobacteria bacterium]|nr:hypothetical protein [Gammaproteobacteria bacterium]
MKNLKGKTLLCPHLADTPIVQALKERVSKDVANMISAMAVPAETVGTQVMNATLTDGILGFL